MRVAFPRQYLHFWYIHLKRLRKYTLFLTFNKLSPFVFWFFKPLNSHHQLVLLTSDEQIPSTIVQQTTYFGFEFLYKSLLIDKTVQERIRLFCGRKWLILIELISAIHTLLFRMFWPALIVLRIPIVLKYIIFCGELICEPEQILLSPIVIRLFQFLLI